MARAGESEQRPEAKIVFQQPCPLERWPDLPIHVLIGGDDRFSPKDFQRRVARERLAKNVKELPGGHLIALSQPRVLANALLGCASELR